MKIIFLCCFWMTLLLPVADSHARTLTIPGDADSVKEAVEMAASGDEIRFETDAIRWIPAGQSGGIRIENKDLVITGRPQLKPLSSQDLELVGDVNNATHPSQYSLLWIENSHVTLRDVDLSKSIAQRNWVGMYPDISCSPIQTYSGSLTIQNCTIENPIRLQSDFRMEDTRFIGSTFIANHPAGYGNRSSYEASLLIHSATGLQCEIRRCILGQGGEESYKQIELSNLQSCKVTIRDCTLESGIFGGLSTYRGGIQVIVGAPGIHVHDCTDVLLDLSGSRIQGGMSRGAVVQQVKPQVPPSGPGMLIERSGVSLHGGTLVGGKGGEGYSLPGADAEGNYPFKARSGSGGFGLQIGTSRVTYSDLICLGGPGGPAMDYGELYGSTPPGPDGEPLSIDEFSTFQEMASLPAWELY